MSWWRRKRNTITTEEEVVVCFDEQHISAKFPDGSQQASYWANLTKVEVHTNDTGPWGADVWFVLHSPEGECSFPLGASGCTEAINRLQKSPHFQLKGMNSTSNDSFVCWERSNAF